MQAGELVSGPKLEPTYVDWRQQESTGFSEESYKGEPNYPVPATHRDNLWVRRMRFVFNAVTLLTAVGAAAGPIGAGVGFTCGLLIEGGVRIFKYKIKGSDGFKIKGDQREWDD